MRRWVRRDGHQASFCSVGRRSFLLYTSSANAVNRSLRCLPGMRVPTEWREPIEHGRVLLLSPFEKKYRRATADLAQKRNEFVAAAHGGDFDALIAVLDPEVVLRADRDPASRSIRGSMAVAQQAIGSSKLVQRTESVIANGAPGIVSWLPN